MHSLRLGLELPATGSSGARMRAAAEAERSGFGSLWVSGAGRDPCVLAAGLVPSTSSIVLGVVSGTGPDDRNPSVLARDVSTLDVLSAGRSAVLLEGDGPALAEAAAVCRLLFDEDAPDYCGERLRLVAAANRPGPVGRPPVVVQAPRPLPDCPADAWIVTGGPADIEAWRRALGDRFLLWRGEPEVGRAGELREAGADGLIVRGRARADLGRWSR